MFSRYTMWMLLFECVVIVLAVRMTFSWAGFMKVVVSGFIFMLQKRESHRSLSVGACFIMMLASVSSFASIDIEVSGLMFLCDS